MNKKEIWPNFFIVGAARSGTTTLYRYLIQHPQVFMPKRRKEPNYFSANHISPDDDIPPVRDKQKYLDLFKGVKNEIAIGEASVTYLHNPDAPYLIKKVSPNAKIIISLRNPIDRAYSHYLQLFNVRKVSISFSDVIKHESDELKKRMMYSGVILDSLYSDYVKKYQDVFGKDNVKIIIFEEWANHEKDTVMEVLQFLGINSSNFKFKKITSHNEYFESRSDLTASIIRDKNIAIMSSLLPYVIRRKISEIFLINKNANKPKLLNSDEFFLESLFKNDILNLEQILGKSLPWYINKTK